MSRKFGRNKYKKLLCSLSLLLIVILCICSCTIENSFFDNDNSKLFNFSVSVPSWKNNDSTSNSKTRATPILGTSLGTSSSFNIIADVYDGNSSYSTIINNEAVSYTNSIWQTTTPHYWPGAANKTVSFYAYYPTNIYSKISHTTAGSAPTLSYTVPDQVTDQIDIMTATGNNVSGSTNSSTPLGFGHIFAAVKFAVGNNGLPSGTVKSITISGINNSGTYTFGSGWALGSTKSSFTVSPSTAITGSSGANITSDTYTMMMIPQTFSNAIISLTYSNGTTFSTTISGTWNAGSSYTYNLSKNVVSNFSYTGVAQTFIALYTGTYRLQVWGAQGGYATDIVISSPNLGKGGYSYGTVYLSANTKLYVCVGSSGLLATTGGYNGGSIAHTVGGAGGGATHIAQTTNRGVLANYASYQNEILIVAGGGGGVDYYGASGYGGGTTGGIGYYNSITCTGGTQTSGGSGTYPGSFGQGACGVNSSSTDWGSGGGGGWYGGGGTDIGTGGGAGGGSGYIGTSVTGTTIAGNQTFESTSGSNETGHSGNGYARITFISAN